MPSVRGCNLDPDHTTPSDPRFCLPSACRASFRKSPGAPQTTDPSFKPSIRSIWCRLFVRSRRPCRAAGAPISKSKSPRLFLPARRRPRSLPKIRQVSSSVPMAPALDTVTEVFVDPICKVMSTRAGCAARTSRFVTIAVWNQGESRLRYRFLVAKTEMNKNRQHRSS